MFCPKCGAILLPKTKDGKKVLACSCGYTDRKGEMNTTMQEKVQKKEEIEVVDKEVETNPIAEVECPKCGHGRAFYWFVQTRAADEPATRFNKCEKCKHIWRDYS